MREEHQGGSSKISNRGEGEGWKETLGEARRVGLTKPRVGSTRLLQKRGLGQVKKRDTQQPRKIRKGGPTRFRAFVGGKRAD